MNSGAQAATDLLFQGACALWPSSMTAERFNAAKAAVLSKHGGATISIGEMNLANLA